MRPRPRRLIRLSLLALASSLWPALAHADEPLWDELSTYEIERVEVALRALDLERDPAPSGKRFGRLIVYAEDVYTDDDVLPLTWLNALHRTTRDEVIADEVIWERGEPYDADRVWETVRNLRQRQALSVVAFVPVRSPRPDEVVDILAVTRDTFSLRISPSLTLTNLTVERLDIFVGERNLAGWHKELGLTGTLEQDTWSLGLGYVDFRLARTRLTLTEEVQIIFNRDGSELEGTYNRFEFGLPINTTRARYGFLLREEHDIQVDRRFSGGEQRTYDDPATDTVEAVPFAIDQREIDALGELYIAIPTRTERLHYRHVLSLGYGIEERDYRLFQVERVEPATAAAFARDVLPRSEFSSFLELGYHLLEERWAIERTYQTYAFSEFVRLGPELLLQLRFAPEGLGSDRDHIDGSLFSGYSTANGGWVTRLGLGVAARFDLGGPDRALIDRTFTGRLQITTPTLGPFRLHWGGRTEIVFGRVGRELQELGGPSGLRGFSEGAFIGDSVALGHIELRTLPIEVLDSQVGGLVFGDVGTIFSEGEAPPPFLADVGIGLRTAGKTSRGIAFRLDWGIPLTGQEDAFPGTFTFGVEQVLGASNLDYSWADALDRWSEATGSDR